MQISQLLRFGAAATLVACGLNAQFLPTGSVVSYATGAGDSDEGYVEVVSLFPVIFPDGSSTTNIQIGSNGLILPSGTFAPGASTYAFLEGLFDFENGPTAIYPYWDDLDSTTADNIFVDAGAALLVITWEDVQPFPASALDPITRVQCQIGIGGDITFVYDTTSEPTAFGNSDCLVGLAVGGAVVAN